MNKEEWVQISMFEEAVKKTPIQDLYELLTDSGTQVEIRPRNVAKWTKDLFISILFAYKDKRFEVLQTNGIFGIKGPDALDLWDGMRYTEGLTVPEILSLICFED